MRLLKRLLNIYIYLALMLAHASAAFAQVPTPTFDVSAAYAALREVDEESFPRESIEQTYHGWVVSGTGYLTRWLGITAEGGSSHGRRSEFDRELKLSIYSAMCGPRFVVFRNDTNAIFVDGLVGVVRLGVQRLEDGDSQVHGALQAGGGIDRQIYPHVGIRLGAGYRRILRTGSNHVRFLAGIAISGGKR
jgi:hypothetical protein